MKTLLQVQDELSTVRQFVDCAGMACHNLSPHQAEPLAAVLDAASEKLLAIRDALEIIRGAPTDMGSDDDR